MKKNYSIGDIVVNTLVYFFLILFGLSILFPVYNMIILSVARFEDSARQGLYLLPRSFTLSNYQHIFKDAQLMNSIWVAVRNVVFGVGMAMVMTVVASYVLSRKNLPGRRFMFYFVIFTMYFGAWLIPWYMVMKSLGFVNNIWVMTIPNALSVFNMILMRNYFMSLPDSLEESARLDGAGEFTIMWRILVPLSKPIMATVGLFYALGFWNEWWNAMLFLQDTKLHPLALFLRRLVIENNVSFGDPMGLAARAANPIDNRALQMATVMVATVPILCVYPFLQKHFTKGIMLGSIKA
jgi:putative aldouronate transport system permease protein